MVASGDEGIGGQKDVAGVLSAEADKFAASAGADAGETVSDILKN